MPLIVDTTDNFFADTGYLKSKSSKLSMTAKAQAMALWAQRTHHVCVGALRGPGGNKRLIAG